VSDLLLYTRMADFRHESVLDGVRALRELAGGLRYVLGSAG
jgi:hypothetical protein